MLWIAAEHLLYTLQHTLPSTLPDFPVLSHDPDVFPGPQKDSSTVSASTECVPEKHDSFITGSAAFPFSSMEGPIGLVASTLHAFFS